MPLTPAPYIYPHDLGHAFAPGLTAIDGGKMDGFNCVTYGDDLTGYTQFSRKTLPAYWALADRFVLADHFFTSMFGPTFPEHLYTIAAQSYGIVDNKIDRTDPGSYCDDPTEHTRRFPIEDLTPADNKKIMGLEDHFLDYPANLFTDRRVLGGHPHVHQYQGSARRAPEGHIPWKYYAEPDHWMNAMQAIKHVRFGPMWNKVQPPDTILTDLQNDKLPAVSWLIPPEGNPNEHPGGSVNICEGENWTVRVSERDLPVRRLAEHRGRDRVGRLRRLLRPRRAAALRHHGPRTAHARADHLAVHASRAPTPTADRSTRRSMSSRACCGSSRSSTGCRR